MSNGRKIITQDQTANVVCDFHPKEFPIVASETADDFVNKGVGKSKDFEIDPLVAEQVGIAEINRRKIEARVEAHALEKLKEVEEQAYHEAYKLGEDEGREQAYNDFKEHFSDRLNKFDELLSAFDTIKEEILEQNEVQFIHLCYEIASKIAMKEIDQDKKIILDVMKKVLDEAQSDEHIVIRLAKSDLNFIGEMKKKGDREVNVLKNVKLESSERMTAGGCILESNFGTIDATVEQRVAKAWEAVAARMPHIKPDEDGVVRKVSKGDGSSDEES